MYLHQISYTLVILSSDEFGFNIQPCIFVYKITLSVCTFLYQPIGQDLVKKNYI